MIKVEKLSKQFHNQVVLDSISFCLEKGTITGLIGRNGAGKTTLLRHLIGAYQAINGTVQIDHQDVFDNYDVKQRTLFIPDEFPELFSDSIIEIKKLYRQLFIHFNEEKYHSYCKQFEFDDSKKVSELSKGMKKQLLFILTLACSPDYLIMDEPFDGVDPSVKRKIWDVLIEETTTREMTILLSSHHLAQLDTMCDHILFIDKNKIVFQEDIDTVRSSYHKVQVLFDDSKKITTLKETVRILDDSMIGAIHTLIIKGDRSFIEEQIKSLNPTMIAYGTVSLEEIFFYTVGGKYHGIESINE